MNVGEALILFSASFVGAFVPVALLNVAYHVWWSRRHEGRWWV
jgi:hypothetical protein